MYYALPKSKNDKALILAVDHYLKSMPHKPDDNFRFAFAYVEYNADKQPPFGVVVRRLTRYSNTALEDIMKNLDRLFDMHNV